jgi:hypothetical protein
VLKRTLGLLCVVFTGWIFFTGVCQARTPQRIAILPVINQSYTDDPEVEKTISEAIYAKFHVPLAAVLNTYEFVPADEIKTAFPEWKDHVRMKKIDRERLQQVAAQLHADMVIGGAVTDLNKFIYTSNFEGDLMQQTYLSIRLVGYNVREQKLIDIGDYEDYRGDWSVFGDSDYLAKKIMDRLLGKIVVVNQ